MREGTPSGQWRRVEALLAAALERPPEGRDAFLDEACGDDTALRAEVASLLAAHERTGAVDRLAPVVGHLAAGLGSSNQTGTNLEGRTIGPYRVLERVGGGGMGVVYRAIDTRLDRTVAIKFLQAHLTGDPRAAERFRIEARAAGTLEHPHVCTVHEVDETSDGMLYLVMPLYEGETLQQRIERGPLAVEHAVTVAVQMLRGLAKAHGRGIIHRDIKPSNVFVTADGVVKLLDFGIAKLGDLTVTGTGAPPGTLAYMSPEHAMGQPVDHRADLWSVGVVLYEMLTGRRPFPHVFAALGAEGDPAAPALATLRAEVLAPLAKVVAKAMARVPADRYQSAAEFEQALVSLGIAADLSSASGAGGSARAPRPTGHARRRWVVAASIAGAVLLGATTLWLGGDRAAAGVTDAASAVPTALAVLPFLDRSPGGDQEHFADGITEELTAALSHVEGLHVVSSTSAYGAQAASNDVREIGRRLGVGAVLEGTVRRAGDQLRISASLVNTSNGYRMWGETYNRPAGDAFAIQEEIARAIAQVLQVRLAQAEPGTDRPPPNPEAYELYLHGQAAKMKARFDRSGGTAAGFASRIHYFEQAIARDSNFIAPYVELATTLLSMGFQELLPPNDVFPRAESVARRALARAPMHGHVHNVIAYVELYHRYDVVRAEASWRQAIALAPRNPVAHQWYGNLLTVTGRFAEAAESMRRAQALDSTSVVAVAAEGWVHYYERDYARALPAFERALRRNPEYAFTHLWRAWALEEMDSLPAAIAAHRRSVEYSDSAAVQVAALAHALARAGERANAESLLKRLEAREAEGQHVPAYEVAKVHLALGRTDQAFAWLERALERRAIALVLMRVDPQLDPLRRDPRYAELEGRVYAS